MARFKYNDLIQFVPDGSDKPLVGRLILCVAEEDHSHKWIVLVVDEAGKGTAFRVWDYDMRMYESCDYDTDLAIKFVVWDALHSK